MNLFKKENVVSEIVNKEVGKDLDFAVKMVNGQLRAELGWAPPGGVASAGLFINLSAQEVGNLVIDKLEQLIPGDQTGMAAGLKLALAAKLAEQAKPVA